ncbi:MAG: 1-(5-phosphoribosyl)-5-[(5-phosphoribosylamino)methylideneamino] imidazole-4-carboxamide isomerase [Actinobacteria bacterium]|nr:1-(5-phosphoribosyl)-5-[(5-phosphoribosylamino)methylideneamino] imidazole-4-carboxamide isomerase [Actinomycetota bacterium]
MFEVIPAIDVMGGRLVRMRKGDPASLREYRGDPVELAERFVEQGARWIHFVDLDAAFGGGAVNLHLLRQVASLGAMVQAGGGLSPDEAREALQAGASRAVLGSGALHDREAVQHALSELQTSVAVGLDVRSGRIVPRGSGTPGPFLDEVTSWLAACGCQRVVYTDVSRDGALSGPDLDGLASLAAQPWSVIASGGVRHREDLDAIEAIGAEGAIVGTAICETGFDLGAALRGRT